jgi:hypothetical protein
MKAGSKVLSNAMVAVAPSSPEVVLTTGGTIGLGAGNAVVPVDLRQRVVAGDRPGTYGITIEFQVIAGF